MTFTNRMVRAILLARAFVGFFYMLLSSVNYSIEQMADESITIQMTMV